MTRRRTFVPAALAALLCTTLALPVQAQRKTEMVFSTVNPPDVPLSLATSNIFAKSLGDDFTFKPFFNSTLAQQGTELVGLQRGTIQMALLQPQDLAQQAPEFGILAAAYVIRDVPHLHAIFRSPVGDELKKLAREKLRVQILTPAYFGARHVNLRGDRSVTKPEDLGGVKMRMPTGEAWQFLGRAIGANPVPIAYSELYTSLQSGVVDGHDNPLPNNRAMKFYEVTNQVVLTGHILSFSFATVGAKFWDSLSPDQQKRLQAAAEKAYAWSDAESQKQEAELVDFHKAQGLKVSTPDRKAFQAYAQKMYLSSKLSAAWPKGMLEKINGL